MIRIDDILEKVASTFSDKDINLIKKAYVFAAQAHQGQIRRSGEPYLSHPLEVADMLADMRLDKTTIAAGLLHDVLEDTRITPKEVQKAFGKDISLLVEGVTKLSRVQESSPATRHAESVRKIIIAMTDDLRVIFIKLADRIHNLKTLTFLPENKQRQIARETLEIYAPIANRLGMGRIKAEHEDLAFRYVDPENYFRITSLVDPQRKPAEVELKKIRKTMISLMKESRIPVNIFYRIKRPYSVHTKLKRQKIEFDQVYDFMALRLITDSAKNCYAALGIIHQQWPHLPNRFRDFIAIPKLNLYQALHTTIITEQKSMFEIQIRTHDMHNLAENGIAAHWRYKEAAPRSIIKDDKRLVWLREMVDLYKEQKNPREFLKYLKTGLLPEEVHVFTPKGKVVVLPLGASALDFAFFIHTEIGLHASEVKINSIFAPLKTILKTGDIIEIITSADSTPSRTWMNIVFTPRARYQINRWLNLQDRKKQIVVGKKLWQKQVERNRLPVSKYKEGTILKMLSSIMNVRIERMEDLYMFLGKGKIILNQNIMEKLLSAEEKKATADILFKKAVTKVTKKPHPDIKAQTSTSPLVHLALCCSPIKGEPIIGYMTSGKGLTIHSLRCSLVQKGRLDQHRMVAVSWDRATKRPSKGKILIKGKDAPGVLAKVTAGIAELGGNIIKAEILTCPDKKVHIRLLLEIRDIEHLQSIIKTVSQIKEILSAERI
ncbi:MAG: bifunctional (p)ppGpp synthetase/guanosine-3',5'-bis(diphosphate) 3'-pyrophosphohydrolase [Candidatus Aminicenantes bacterium]|nr:bifunctional (p)ppGpp synthetase/guanosine-3',5'-bis(diphosphate) 3'-pyrophosphohydrolase [Candidatus Aminicenantes bacterium]